MADPLILFFSYYSDENFKLSQALMSNSKSMSLLWNNELMQRSKTDFMTVMSYDQSSTSQISMTYSTPHEYGFLESIYSIFLQCEFRPDAIVVRGETSDLWPFPNLKKNCIDGVPLFLLLDKVPKNIDDNDMLFLEQFDTIFSLCPIPEELLSKFDFVHIFKRFDSNIFGILSNKIDMDQIDGIGPIVLTNGELFKSVSSDTRLSDEISIVNVDECPQEELSVYLSICDRISMVPFDQEIDLLLKKMGRNWVPIESLLVEEEEKYHKYAYILESQKYLEEFCSYLKKNIEERLLNNTQTIITGEDKF